MFQFSTKPGISSSQCRITKDIRGHFNLEHTMSLQFITADKDCNSFHHCSKIQAAPFTKSAVSGFGALVQSCRRAGGRDSSVTGVHGAVTENEAAGQDREAPVSPGPAPVIQPLVSGVPGGRQMCTRQPGAPSTTYRTSRVLRQQRSTTIKFPRSSLLHCRSFTKQILQK